MADARDATSDVDDFVHTGPGTLAGRFFRQFWLAICQSRDLEREWSGELLLVVRRDGRGG